MSLRAWLRPPQSPLVILCLLTLASISALGWFGWQLLQQDSVVEEQRAQERLDQAADRIAIALRGTLAEMGEHLSGSGDARTLPDPVFVLTDNSLVAVAPTRLLYRPFSIPMAEAPASSFEEGEALEFQQGQPVAASEWYRRLAKSPDPATRGGALLRLGRVLRKLGRDGESRATYEQLAAIEHVAVAGAPASLVGRTAVCGLTKQPSQIQALKNDLLRGRWPLSRGQFEFYWSEAARLAGQEEAPPAMSPDLQRAATIAWRERNREPAARGQATLWVDGTPVFLLWRGDGEQRAMVVSSADSILKQSLAGEDVYCAAVDGEGRVVAGRKDGEGRAVVRTAAESQLPWTLRITRAKGVADNGLFMRQRFLMLGIVVMVVFLITGSYFIGRAIRREAAVARLQNDFVSAVSHEFRSPLTSLRQLSEMLALGRLPNEDRRQLYYRTLVAETERLQRLVETLLNFGGMEAGARRYRFEELDAAAVVEPVTAEFEAQIAASGRHIEVTAAEAKCCVQADREALSIAVRNLLDNALKYSAEAPKVWVEWGRENGSVAIRVRDEGPGIAASERKAIFHKFVRGSAAASGGVKGMGVGLAVVRHIVLAHGGEIRLASEVGEGSTFTILLPAVSKT